MDDDAYLAALAAAPDDDELRLVWADALQARGDLRGELIALQVAQARALDRGDADQAEAFTDAADELLADHEDAWTPPGLAAAVEPGRVGFRRGFVASVAIRGRDLVACADELLASVPVLDLHLKGLTQEEATQLAAMPQLARVRVLDLDGLMEQSEAEIATLLASPHLTGVRALYVGYEPQPGLVELLQRSEALAGLEALHAGFAPTDLRRLLASSALPALCALTLWRDRGGDDDGGDPLLLPHRRERWTHLHLEARNRDRDDDSDDYVDDGDLLSARLAAGLPALRELHLDVDRLGGRGISALLAAELPALRHLRLPHAGLGNRDVEALLASPLATRLEALDLSGNRIDPTWTARELAGIALPALRSLDLSSTHLGAAAARVLAGWKLPALETLALASTQVGDQGAAALASSSTLAALRVLDLDYARVSASGARALADGRGLPALRELGLAGVELDGPALAALGESPGLPRLRGLRVGGQLDAGFLTTLVRTPLMARLVSLECAGRLRTASITALAGNPDARRLRHLRLRFAQGVAAGSLRTIARSPHLARLRELDRSWKLADADARGLRITDRWCRCPARSAAS